MGISGRPGPQLPRAARDVPLALVTYGVPLSPATSFTAAFGAESGISKYSVLDWYDARTPMPDNYRYLPSYAGDRERAGVAFERPALHADRLGLTIRRNRMAGGHAVYALEDRAEQLCNLSLNALLPPSGPAADTPLRGRPPAQDDPFKQMRDLLGAEYVTDIDRFLVDDDTATTICCRTTCGIPTVRSARRPLQLRLAHRPHGLGPVQADYRSDRFRADLSRRAGQQDRQPPGLLRRSSFPGRSPTDARG